MLRQRAACVLLALAALVLFSAPASAQLTVQSASEQVDAQAAILTNGEMTKLDDMDFGTIVRPTVAGTVTMVPGSATCTGSAGIIHTGACVPARFSIKFRKHDKNRVREMNNGTIALTGPGGATMTVTNFSISVTDMTLVSTGGPQGTFGRYDISSDSGIAEFQIGGRLNIVANQAVGIYTGTLTMNVIVN